MNDNVDISKQRTIFNWAQFIGALVFVASVTWTISQVYFRFEKSELENKTLKERIEYVDSRITRVLDPIKKDINDLKDYHKK